MRINYEDLVDKSLEGSCIVDVYDSYYDARKTIILSVQEIVVTEPTSPRKQPESTVRISARELPFLCHPMRSYDALRKVS